MLIDATDKFAAHTGDPQVLALKQRLVDETLKTQEPDGYFRLRDYRASVEDDPLSTTASK
jgi:hypothetical protein